jgi:hypothetical protein
MESNQVKIDLVTKRPDGGCTLVLVETGPWIGEQKNQNMQRLGNRIAGCVSAVINGHVARRYPATIGVPLTIQVDSYDTPRLEVDILLAKMQNEFDKSPEIQEGLRSGRLTSAILLRHRWSDFASELAKRRPSHRFWHRLKRLFGLGVPN